MTVADLWFCDGAKKVQYCLLLTAHSSGANCILSLSHSSMKEILQNDQDVMSCVQSYGLHSAIIHQFVPKSSRLSSAVYFTITITHVYSDVIRERQCRGNFVKHKE